MYFPTTWEDDEGKLKLMVVDDEPDNLDLLYRTFRREFDVYTADSGFSALDLLAKEGEMGIIISDQRMPLMNGTEFLSRTAEQYPDTIRIVLTGYTDVEDLVEAINTGRVFKYITKPWNSENLQSVVKQAAETYRVVKRRTRDLLQTLERESFGGEVMRVIRESLDYENMLQTIATTLGQRLQAAYVVLHAVAASTQDDAPPELGAAFSYLAEDSSLAADLERLQEHLQAAGKQALQTGNHHLDSLSLAASGPVDALTMPFIYQPRTLAVVTIYRSKVEEAWLDGALQLIKSVAEQVALAISQAKLYQRTQLQTEQMSSELEVARQVQTKLLRQSLPDIEGLRIQARCFPAREVGGDFFEAFVHPDGDIWLAVGDVSGKGVPAALFMTSAISVLRRELVQATSPSPDQVMQNLNEALIDGLVSSNCFITMALMCYNPTTRQLTYANAGHVYPLIWSAAMRQSESSEPQYLKATGLPLGIMPVWQARLPANELTLQIGDTLLLTSDGLTEVTLPSAAMSSTVMLQQKGLWELIQQQSSSFDLDALLAKIRGDRTEQDDDQTVLLLEVMA